MSSMRNKTNTSPFGLTPREVEMAVLAWKCVDDNGKANSHKQVNPQKLAELTNHENVGSVARRWRGIKAKIAAATGGVFGTPDGTSDGGIFGTPKGANSGSEAAVGVDSPSVSAGKKRAVAVAGRKRNRKEVDSDEEMDDADKGMRPKKAAMRAQSRIAALDQDPAQESGGSGADEAEV
ncbi:hypothetical protein J7T55_009843 [Diaporthe amygdali]|uniref:uncharacterized protein n=1 Tax=Phomopsis amygdali TaxID=1214568 RepID=UPI0022FEA55C|nr:uncharacterized protein J7T55_009843 [Diaporthe amygdali]KAJ0116693.1 hypothetical protein J7T55_009843 [Diaporthe amygdali]